MGRNRILLAVSLALTGLGGAALAAGVAPAPATVQLSSGPPTSAPVAPVGEETTTTAVPETTTSTTVPATTTTTVVHATTTSTTAVAPHPATTTPLDTSNKAMIDSIVNHYPAAIDYAIGSDDSDAHWVLQPNQSGSVIMLTVGYHDHSASHRVDMPACGRGDQDSYFTGGHHYSIEIVENGLPDGCGPGVPGYWSILRDLTAGTSKQV